MSAAVQLRNSDLASALTEAREAYVAARPASQALHERARAVMPGGNTRTVLIYSPFPTAMQGGEGCYLHDIDGRDYLDLCGEYTAGLFGHSEMRIQDVVREAMGRGLNLAAVGEAETNLASLICSRFPSVEYVRFTNSGTEANLMALTAARVHTGRNTIMAFRGGYHGGVLLFPLSGTNPATVPFPFLMADYNDAEGAVALIRENADRLAAVIVEPMLGSGGCIPARPDFLAALREATTEAGIALIFDEVMTSRMSAGGLQLRHGITPDMTTLGKYMAGGMTFGAFGGRAEIMGLFDGKIAHAGTFNNNVLSMAAGNVALGEIFTAEAADALFARGEAMRARLNDILARAGTAMHFSGIGSMMTVQFRTGPIERPAPSSAEDEALRELFFFDMLAAGIYLARRGMIALSLPVGDAEIDRMVAAVADFAEARAALLPRA
jgi:glutamate-1-semialdehyde 2,1-aminomutase